jgi:hypothetical protein
LPPDTLLKLLEKKLYPVLDTLPTAQKVVVYEALAGLQRESNKIQQNLKAIGYDTHKKSLDGAVKALIKDVNRNWKNGWEEQGEMMQEMAAEILEWLPTLWRTAVEDGHEFQLIRKSLLLCTDTCNAIANCNSRAEFGDMDFEVTITDSENTIVYEETSADIDHTLAWMWRELLVAASAQGSATKAIESDINRLKIEHEVYNLIRTDGRKSKFPCFIFGVDIILFSQKISTKTVTIFGMHIGPKP